MDKKKKSASQRYDKGSYDEWKYCMEYILEKVCKLSKRAARVNIVDVGTRERSAKLFKVLNCNMKHTDQYASSRVFA